MLAAVKRQVNFQQVPKSQKITISSSIDSSGNGTSNGSGIITTTANSACVQLMSISDIIQYNPKKLPRLLAFEQAPPPPIPPSSMWPPVSQHSLPPVLSDTVPAPPGHHPSSCESR